VASPGQSDGVPGLGSRRKRVARDAEQNSATRRVPRPELCPWRDSVTVERKAGPPRQRPVGRDQTAAPPSAATSSLAFFFAVLGMSNSHTTPFV
jgi:hypothetical protein